jgi:ABC-2 type transport system ATP-binding protein
MDRNHVLTVPNRGGTSGRRATDTDQVVTVRGLCKSYRGVSAVDGIDLDVRRGEVLALLGPNGAGKSTTVEILEGYRSRDAGEVSVLGCDPARAGGAWRSQIGIVLQESRDATALTVAEVVRYFSAYYPHAREVDETIELVGLTAKRDARIGRLSGGQRRRLDVAIGILGRPELLFLDEPTTGFDPEARRAFWKLILRLAGEGTTMVLTTHYLDEAEALADRVVVIDAGRVIAAGAPATIGGRKDSGAIVRWSGPDGPSEVRSTNPTRLITELAEVFGGEVPDLSVTRPSLEDVYLQMTAAAEAPTPPAPPHEGEMR